MKLDPIVLSIPIFFVLIGIELVVERFSNRKLYRFPDAIANLGCGITSQLSGLFLKVLAIGVYELVYSQAALFQLPRTWWYWVALFFLVDLAYYWAHRMSHEINLFWGGHVVHHQSEDYNLSVALRQSSFQTVWTFAFSLPIALMGFSTLDFALISALNTLYQFWIHTEAINKMGWLEYFLNTPSHHRVHHGRNPKYIDKNHAGTLIIWDRLFGTFQEEEERPTYGITKPLQSWNPLWANFSHYASMVEDLKRIPNGSDKIKYLFKKPGWMPEAQGGYRSAPEVDLPSYHKYETPAPIQLNYYVLFQYALCLGCASLLLFKQANYSLFEKSIAVSLLSLWVVNCSVLFESRRWVFTAEWVRIILFTSLLAFATWAMPLSLIFYGVSLVYLVISGVWFYSISYVPSSKRA